MFRSWLRLSLRDGEGIGAICKPCLCGRVDPASYREHVLEACLSVLVEQRVVMGDAVAKTLDAAHAGAEILAGQCFVWESGPEAMPPQLLVTTAEQPGPEGEGDSGNDAPPRDELASLKALDGDDHLLDPVRLEDLEVQKQVSLIGTWGWPSPSTPSIALRRSTSKR